MRASEEQTEKYKSGGSGIWMQVSSTLCQRNEWTKMKWQLNERIWNESGWICETGGYEHNNWDKNTNTGWDKHAWKREKRGIRYLHEGQTYQICDWLWNQHTYKNNRLRHKDFVSVRRPATGISSARSRLAIQRSTLSRPCRWTLHWGLESALG